VGAAGLAAALSCALGTRIARKSRQRPAQAAPEPAPQPQPQKLTAPEPAPESSGPAAPPQPQPPAHHAVALLGAPQLTPSGPPGTYEVACGYQYAVMGPDSRASSFTVSGGTVLLAYADAPADIRNRVAAAIRTQQEDPALAVTFLTGGTG